MESKSFSLSNKQTPGKYYRKMKNLRKSDCLAEIQTFLSSDLEKYISILKSKNLEIHPNLLLATFKTRNSLNYTGIITTNYINPNEILLKIPRDLLLTTKTAYYSDLKEIFDNNPELYSRYLEKNWEDNILLTFLLYEYQKKELSHWHFLIKLLPRDIDYLAFWSEKELDLLEDPYLKNKSKLLLKEFDETYQRLSEVLSKYPDKLHKDSYSYENVKWIHIHLITRSFGGKYLNYVTMVPFAEFFNHECTNVYYDFKQISENTNITSDKNPPMSEEWEENLSTSNESDISQESVDSDDFFKENNSNNSNVNDPLFDKKLLENDKIADFFRETIEWILNSIDLGDIISIFYFNEILWKLLLLKKTLLTKKKNNDINEAFAQITVLNLKYKYHLLQYMSENKGLDLDANPILTQKKIFIEPQKSQKNLEALKQKNFSDPNLWKDDDFEYMILRNSEKDYFLKNSQVYFCYGRLSNRKLLSRYGMALEYNKYDHVFIKITFLDYLKTSKDFINYLKNFELQKTRVFKLQATKFNLDFLLFSKGIHWNIENNKIEELFEQKNLDLEIMGLNFMKEIIEKSLNKLFITDYKENFEMISDKNLNYHEHFAVIYRIERQRILLLHKKIVNVAIEIVRKMQKGLKFDEASQRVEEFEEIDEWEKNRWILKIY